MKVCDVTPEGKKAFKKYLELQTFLELVPSSSLYGRMPTPSTCFPDHMEGILKDFLLPVANCALSTNHSVSNK